MDITVDIHNWQNINLAIFGFLRVIPVGYTKKKHCSQWPTCAKHTFTQQYGMGH
jgi:hypothetical protein